MSSCIDENNYYGGKQDVTDAVKIRLYPTDEQKKLINQNIGNRGFIWNKLLVKIKYENVKPTQKNLNNILKELKNEYSFLEKRFSYTGNIWKTDFIQLFVIHRSGCN